MKAKQEAEKAELEAKAAEEAKLRAAAEAEEARLKAEEVYKSRMIPSVSLLAQNAGCSSILVTVYRDHKKTKSKACKLSCNHNQTPYCAS